jgi:hypothetical protein
LAARLSLYGTPLAKRDQGALSGPLGLGENRSLTMLSNAGFNSNNQTEVSNQIRSQRRKS